MFLRLSWNGYLTYRNCSLRYKNIYILKKKPTVMRDDYNLIYGSVMHEIVESFYKLELWKLGKDCRSKILDLAQSYFKNILKRSSIIWQKANRKSPEDLLNSILEDAPKILEVIKKYRLLSKLVFPECKLKAKFDQYQIDGRADLILLRSEGLTLIDGKGSKSKSPDHSEQLLFYILCYYFSKKQIPKFTGIWYFRDAKIEWLSFKSEDFDRLRSEILKTFKSIENQIFEPTDKSENCFWCEYKNTCLVQKDHLETPFGEIVQAFF